MNIPSSSPIIFAAIGVSLSVVSAIQHPVPFTIITASICCAALAICAWMQRRTHQMARKNEMAHHLRVMNDVWHEKVHIANQCLNRIAEGPLNLTEDELLSQSQRFEKELAEIQEIEAYVLRKTEEYHLTKGNFVKKP